MNETQSQAHQKAQNERLENEKRIKLGLLKDLSIKIQKKLVLKILHFNRTQKLHRSQLINSFLKLDDLKKKVFEALKL